MKITVDEYNSQWKGDKRDYLLVDFRNWKEIKEGGGTVEKSMPASLEEVYSGVDMIPTFIDCVGICKTGEESKKLCEHLRNKGLDNIFYIEGGADALIQS